MSKLSAKVREEVVAVIPPTIFFLFTLSLIAVIRVLMLRGTGVPVSSWFQIAVGALLLGKAVVIADHLPFINRYPERPLAYNIAWKTAIYTLVAMLIHYVEHLIDFWKQAGGLIAGNERLLAEIVWPHFWAIQIILVILIFGYCAMHELARLLGREKVRELFFGLPAKARV
ncbi:MAG TPA: hypothetical protein VG425_14070 [Casimicrobiaceae bacterium]|nr:hypothetical protein [Casimicrobiaceae bacterium]